MGQMKEFNLREALKGKPVKLRNGDDALVSIFDAECAYDDDAIFGSVDGESFAWRRDGSFLSKDSPHKYDIIGMLEDEPEFTLPKPIRKIEPSKVYYYISNGIVELKASRVTYASQIVTLKISKLNFKSSYVDNLLKSGQVFGSKKDAQAWLNFMKNYGNEE